MYPEYIYAKNYFWFSNFLSTLEKMGWISNNCENIISSTGADPDPLFSISAARIFHELSTGFFCIRQ